MEQAPAPMQDVVYTVKFENNVLRTLTIESKIGQSLNSGLNEFNYVDFLTKYEFGNTKVTAPQE